MSIDEEALLAAIDATPLDDAPRLIYADWLQERGEEARADYLRAVVMLLHSPEDAVALNTCVTLSGELDAAWRKRIGARFEIVVEGFSATEVIARFLFAAVRVHWTLDESTQSPEPFRLVCNLMREDAEKMRHEFEPFANAIQDSRKHTIRLVIQAMQDESSFGLLG